MLLMLTARRDDRRAVFVSAEVDPARRGCDTLRKVTYSSGATHDDLAG